MSLLNEIGRKYDIPKSTDEVKSGMFLDVQRYQIDEERERKNGQVGQILDIENGGGAKIIGKDGGPEILRHTPKKDNEKGGFTPSGKKRREIAGSPLD